MPGWHYAFGPAGMIRKPWPTSSTAWFFAAKSPSTASKVLPADEKAAAVLKQRTLTNLYNERPTWLANAHRESDEAVAAAYGWPADLSDDEVSARLLALNQDRQ